MKKKIVTGLMLAVALAIPVGLVSTAGAATSPGLHIANGRLVERNGNAFVFRGVNHAHTWYTSQTQSFADMSALGANSVRTVLSSGDRWTRNDITDVRNVIQLAKNARMISILEVHDTTGYGEDGAAVSLGRAVDYWISIKDALIGQEDYVLLNIGNEPFGNNAGTNQGYVSANTDAIQRLRAAGIGNTIVVDAPNWGQDWSGLMRDSAATIFNSDADKNVLFSVHMYGVYDTAAEIRAYMSAFQSAGLPLIVGEFGNNHSDGNPDEDTILSEAQSRGIGWLGWSWSGNGGGVEYLDLVTGFNRNSLSQWGQRLFNGANGIVATATRASIFSGSTPTPTPTPTSTPTSTPNPTDTIAPTTPGTPSVSSITSSSASLAWSASTDNVGVTGYTVRNASTGAVLATTTSPSATLSGLSASTSYTVNVVARDAAGNTSTASSSRTFSTSGVTAGACTAVLTVVNSWPDGFQAEVKVTAGSSATNGWTTAFTLASGTSISNLWSGKLTTSGSAATVANADWNGQVGAGQSTTYGFVVAGRAAPGSVTCAVR